MAGLGLVIPRAGGGGPVVVPETTYASEDFTLAGADVTANGRTLNNALGGSATKTFETALNSAFMVGGGTLHRTTVGGAAGVLGVAMPQADYSLYIKAGTITVGSVSLLARRSAIAGGTDSRISLNANGTITGAITSTWTAGDIIGYRVRGTSIDWLKNGAVIGTSTALNSAAGYAAISVGANTEYSIDDWKLRLPV